MAGYPAWHHAVWRDEVRALVFVSFMDAGIISGVAFIGLTSDNAELDSLRLLLMGLGFGAMRSFLTLIFSDNP